MKHDCPVAASSLSAERYRVQLRAHLSSMARRSSRQLPWREALKAASQDLPHESPPAETTELCSLRHEIHARDNRAPHRRMRSKADFTKRLAATTRPQPHTRHRSRHRSLAARNDRDPLPRSIAPIRIDLFPPPVRSSPMRGCPTARTTTTSPLVHPLARPGPGSRPRRSQATVAQPLREHRAGATTPWARHDRGFHFASAEARMTHHRVTCRHLMRFGTTTFRFPDSRTIPRT